MREPSAATPAVDNHVPSVLRKLALTPRNALYIVDC